VALILYVYESFYARALESEPRQVALFADPAMTRLAVLVPPESVRWLADTGEVRGVRGGLGVYSPIIRWGHVWTARGPGGRTLYGTPDLLYSPRSGTPWPESDGFRRIASALAVLLAAVGARLCAGRGFRRALAGLAALRVASLWWLFACYGFYTIHSNDETHYLNISRKLFDWSLRFDEYPYTLGLPLLYAPLSAAWRSASAFVFAGAFGFVSFAVFGVGTVVLVAVVLRRIGFGRRAVLATGLALVLYPVAAGAFHGSLEGEPAAGMFLGQHVRVPPDVNHMALFNASDLLGYNALSDLPALFFGVLGLALLGRAASQRKPLIWAGLTLGFACLIRIASVFLLLPAGLTLLWYRDRLAWRRLVGFGFGLAAMAGAQMAWNAAIFGSPFTLGYEMRPEDYKGFQGAWFARGIDLLGSLHYQPLVWAGVSLLYLMRRRAFTAATLALLILPTFLFYAGYHATGTSPMRFVILPVFGMLAALGLHLGQYDDRRTFWWTVGLVFGSLAVMPELPGGAFLVALPGWVAPSLFAVLAAASAVHLREWRLPTGFAMLAIGIDWAAVGFLAAACSGAVGQALARVAGGHR
jgi:hypothetical protein